MPWKRAAMGCVRSPESVCIALAQHPSCVAYNKMQWHGRWHWPSTWPNGFQETRQNQRTGGAGSLGAICASYTVIIVMCQDVLGLIVSAHDTRNTVKVRDWIDLVFVKRRFYSAEASHVASVSRTQVLLCCIVAEHWPSLVPFPQRAVPCAAEVAEAMLVVYVQSVGSARSTASRESDFGLRLAGRGGWQWRGSPTGM